ncbi:MAG: hypothetical protein GTO51_00170, partial [Candidatus Latescibacteria bacterium]|nr:hypothetical protein [Candidatus Latescibacterota bacterium]NIM64396.1 hypothetical protein [Candidatus Latescibacterota bacterium]NIO00550.1 hypothetical protein [Candidatus Latescibacterota bacterium]NIO26950.1 hypothetical protein [Candidatus Latescibacterota bacterium]NIO56027.1 hypothetical protein [Candidatus Latescibacterota bacterium]
MPKQHILFRGFVLFLVASLILPGCHVRTPSHPEAPNQPSEPKPDVSGLANGTGA